MEAGKQKNLWTNLKKTLQKCRLITNGFPAGELLLPFQTEQKLHIQKI